MAVSRTEALKKINALIKGIKIAMFTTIASDGSFHSRPMDTQEQEFDGDVWFFSEGSARKVTELHSNANVNVSYASGNSYVSMAGKATIVTDVAKKKELWKPDLQAWFKNGPEDPNVVLVKINAESAEYWDGPPGGMIGSAIAAVTVMLTGNEEAYGENERVKL
ncbi:MAG: pyridoxamine 5'-phosphate oxidase family protein [Chloroflexota bacterium]|nr:pyridoxamine 5'-phosphate oxidase family protein [Chloroflexota bacterium]